MDQATAFVQNNGSMIGTVVFIVLALIVLYVIYSYIYPSADPTFVQLLQNEADARSPVPISARPPSIHTGGDFTISMWIYIDDWNYRVASPKFLFAIQNQDLKIPIVAILNPYKNSMTVGVDAVGSGSGSSAAPSLTDYETLVNLLTNKISMSMFESGLGSGAKPYPNVGPLGPGGTQQNPEVGDNSVEVKEIPLQRWTCLTFVSSGSSRLLDIYVDGKLTRSTVFSNMLKVPRGNLSVRLGEFNGFGGRYSSVQMWNQQLTPDVIYGIYMMGPTQSQHNILTDISKYLNLNVSFTGSAPGQPIQTVAPSNPFGQMGSTASQGYAGLSTDASQGYSSIMQRL
jgi:hypothetical protein